ncbi:uncharacterized protein LOC134692621 [Mytilus trossulus]|uniref:uncharacterized protein LOC134692621 n=1 Tax=Mytilus trossulus TaxID=6551 RepID=UPI003003F12D
MTTRPNLNRAACSDNRYQPFIFETVGHSDCTFQKSFCSSFGQETYVHGDTTVDRKCICNTDRGYIFVRNSNNQCNCNPSTEDCSCYLGINPYNKTIELKDVKCYHDMKMLSSPFLGDSFSISRTIKIIEFDDYKYNLNYFPTNEYRIKAATSILTLLLAYYYFSELDGPIVMELYHNEIEKQNIVERRAAMKDGKELRRYVRIQVIGKEGVGKSSLVRRLVGESIRGCVEIMDGNECQLTRVLDRKAEYSSTMYLLGYLG